MEGLEWEKMERVLFVRWRMGEMRTLVVPVGKGRDVLAEECPVCGVKVGEVRRWRDAGMRYYFALHEGELHDLGVFGRICG